MVNRWKLVLTRNRSSPDILSTMPLVTNLAELMLPASAIEAIFDALTDAACFIKDSSGRYQSVNQSLVERCGLKHKAEMQGRTVRDLFPVDLAARYESQDREVLQHGRSLHNKLELHWLKPGRTVWCLTTKLPWRDAGGRIVGLIGISRDLMEPGDAKGIPSGVAKALDYLDKHFADDRISPAQLARIAGMNQGRFARLVKRIFQITPGQKITQARLNAAAQLLQERDDTVAEIAVACGFCDHSAFTRAFRAATGMTPTQFRARFELGP